jgi:hypothetical protein
MAGLEALLLILAWKGATFLVALLAAGLLDPAYAFPERYDVTLGDAWSRLESALRLNWDGRHYQTLADLGYGPYPSLNAFQPLYPLLIRALNPLFGDSLVSGLVVANAASTAGLWLFYRYVRERYSPSIAGPALVLLLAFPTAFFFNLVYTEGLFLLLSVAVFWGLASRRALPLLVAGVAAFLLPTLRYVGVFIAAPMAVALLTQGVSWGRSMPRQLLANLLRPRTLLLAAPLLGFVAYLLYMNSQVGDAMAGFRAQEEFIGHKDVKFLLQPGRFLSDLFRDDLLLHDYVLSILDRWFFIWFVASLPLLWRRVDRPLFVFCALLGLVPLLGTFMSYMRYVLPAFGLFIAYGGWLSERRQSALWGVVLAMGMFQALLLSLFVLNHWVA